MPASERRRPVAGATPPETYPNTASNGSSKDTAALRRSEGMVTALQSVQPTWRAEAEAVLDALIASGATFTADDIRDVAGEPYATGSARSLGGIINGRFRSGEIVPVGWAISRQPQRHQGVLRVWRGVRS